jgi:gliding motility-associated protein GldM
MNLAAVQAKDQYDVPMDELVGPEPMTPEAGKSGMKLWKAYNDYRSNLVKLVGTYTVNGKDWTINPTAINNYKDFNDLTKQVEAMIEKSNCNKKEDKGKLRDLYIELTKPEKVMAGGEGEEQKEWPWIGKTFDHAPLVAAIASLTSLQVEVLGARASAFEHIKSRVSTGEFSFNSIEGFAVGPTMVTQGDVAELKVMMAAFDTDNQPVISGGSFTVQNGQGIMKVPTSGIGDKTLSGTVKIRKKSGDWAEKPWTYTVKIIKASGTISQPEMRVLFRGYPNVIEAAASGYDKVSVSGDGVSLKQSGNQWVATPGGGAKCKILLKGTNSVTKKSGNIGTYDFDIKPMPKAELKWGSAWDGEAGSRTATQLYAVYGPGITLTKAKFTIKEWIMTIPGAPKSVSGSGSTLSPEAMKFLKAAPKGVKVSFSCIYDGTGVKNKTTGGSFKL